MKLYEENFQARIKYFFPVWLFPFLAIFAATNEQLNGTEETWFNESFILWIFFVVNLPVMYGWMSRKIPIREMVIFWWLGPFVLWVVLVILKVEIIGT